MESFDDVNIVFFAGKFIVAIINKEKEVRSNVTHDFVNKFSTVFIDWPDLLGRVRQCSERTRRSIRSDNKVNMARYRLTSQLVTNLLFCCPVKL